RTATIELDDADNATIAPEVLDPVTVDDGVTPGIDWCGLSTAPIGIKVIGYQKRADRTRDELLCGALSQPDLLGACDVAMPTDGSCTASSCVAMTSQGSWEVVASGPDGPVADQLVEASGTGHADFVKLEDTTDVDAVHDIGVPTPIDAQ